MGTSSRDELARLAALASWQRGELDRLNAQAAADAVTERAIGILMERLACSAEQARQQLDRLAAEAGASPAEIAADIAGEHLALPPAERRAVSVAGAAAAAAPDAAHLAEALLTDALAAEGADAVAVWLLAPDGGLDLAGQAGFGLLEAGHWRRVPPGVPFPALRAVRRDTEIWWPAGQPPGDDSILIGPRPGCARAVVPLRLHGTCLGALEVCWPSALAEFPGLVRRQLPALAGPCAQALSAGMPPGTLAGDYSAASVLGVLAGLCGSVLLARPLGGEHGDLAGLVIEWVSDGFRDPAGRAPAGLTGRPLAEAYPEAAQAGGLLDAAAQVLAAGQPQRIAGLLLAGTAVDVSIARLFDGVVIAWQDASEAGRLAALLEQAQWLGQAGGWEENLVTGQVHWADTACALFGLPPGHPVRLADLDRQVPAEDASAVQAFRDRLARQAGGVAAAFRIIRADDASVRQLRVLAEPVTGPGGDLIAVRGTYQDVSDRYHVRAAFSVTQQQLASTEQQAREEHELAMRLQQAITPQISQPVETAGIEVAARYRPASQEHLVGGDWYDAVLLPGKNVLLAVGDVTGHGTGAVAGMVELRNYLRGLAVTGAGPGALLAWLNTAAFHLADTMATVICGIYDPSSLTLRWARAGHFPPLLIRGGTARVPSPPDGVLLGADPDAAYQEATLKLRLGDVVVMFTDGLIERRGEPIDQSLEHLAQTASRPAVDIGRLAADLLAASPADTDDDTCLLAVSIR